MANKQTYLGEFEHMVLLSIASLKDDAYGVTIRQHLKDSIDRDVTIGALYATTERLEKKGFIETQLGGATAERGGKAKRYMQVTASGAQALQDTKAQLDMMWQKLASAGGVL